MLLNGSGLVAGTAHPAGEASWQEAVLERTGKPAVHCGVARECHLRTRLVRCSLARRPHFHPGGSRKALERRWGMTPTQPLKRADPPCAVHFTCHRPHWLGGPAAFYSTPRLTSAVLLSFTARKSTGEHPDRPRTCITALDAYSTFRCLGLPYLIPLDDRALTSALPRH